MWGGANIYIYHYYAHHKTSKKKEAAATDPKISVSLTKETKKRRDVLSGGLLAPSFDQVREGRGWILKRALATASFSRVASSDLERLLYILVLSETVHKSK
jgi:hypothetical protein